uniref:Uncharacterized protein n=1 Tax=Trichogramma kaykai TaxID=54128 RepID=A0ABD2X0K5_9HYME
MYFDIKSSTSDEEPHPVMIRKRRYKAGLYKNYEEKKILLDVRTQLKWNDLGSKIKEKNHHKVSMKSIKEKRKTDSSNTEGDSSDDSYSLVNLENHMDVVSFPNPTCRDHDENVHTFEKNSTISSQDYSNLESVESSPEQNEDETYSVDTDYDEDDEDDDEDDNDDEGEKMDPKNNWIHNILFEGYQLSVHMILYSTTKKKFRRQANIICEVCNSSHSITLKSRNYFISVDLEYQLNLLMDNEEIKNEILKSRDKKKSDDDKIIRDIDDSELFKSIPRAKKDEILITYNFSIDGAPLTNSGKLGFWPLQIILNCLTPKLRFKNVLLAGIMSCKSEPKSNLMNLYMSKFLDQAKKLYEEGIPMVDEFKKCISVKFAPLSCPVDTVTRPILQNRLQFNAFYGCSWCYDIGKHVLKVGVRYPLKSDSISRSSRSYQIDVQLAERKKETLENRRKKKNDLTLKGVKGDICQSKLTHFDMILFFYPLQSGFFSREDIDNRNNENRGRARLPRRPNHYTYWRLKRQRADVLDGVDAQVDLSNRLVVPETEDIDPEEKVKYEMIGEKTYLGVGKMVKTEAWNVTKKRSAWIFLKDVSQMIWGKRTLVNRCLNPSQSYIRLKDRSPRKQVMPRKYKVVKGNNF